MLTASLIMAWFHPSDNVAASLCGSPSFSCTGRPHFLFTLRLRSRGRNPENRPLSFALNERRLEFSSFIRQDFPMFSPGAFPVMLKKIARLLQETLTGLFCCKSKPDVPDAAAPGEKNQGPFPNPAVNGHSDVTLTLSANEQPYLSGDRNGVVLVPPDTVPGNLPNGTNHPAPRQVAQTPSVLDPPGVDEVTLSDASSVSDGQPLPGLPKDAVRCTTPAPSEKDDHTQTIAVAPGTLDGQLGTEPEREDEARNSSRGQLIHDDLRPSVDGRTKDAPDTENILLDAEKVYDMQPWLVQQKQPRRKKVDPHLAPESDGRSNVVEAEDDPFPQPYKERLPRKRMVSEGEEMLKSAPTTKDRLPRKKF
ncbi:hypothetical protein V8E55_003242 [Tylopilus felleus]